jgi:hypothetical protein
MMKSKLILSVLVAIVCVSCGNGEYAYNEAAAAQYYKMSDQFEECYKEFTEGKYQTKFEYNNDEYANFNPPAVAARNLKKNAELATEHFNLLNPSKKAQAFHDKVNEYFKLVGNDFADALQAYADLNCDCPEQKDSLKLVIKNTYSRISNVEDQCLEEQTKYIESVGGHGKSRE